MKSLPLVLVAAAAIAWVAPKASGMETFLSDNFTVTSNSQNVNQELELRQSGPLAPFTYSTTGNQHQVGNNSTNVGQPGGVADKDFLLLAFNSSFRSDLAIGSVLAQGSPLKISFDMYVTGNPQMVAADMWGAFTLRNPGDGWPVAGAGEFGMLMRNDGRIQMFQEAAPEPAEWDVAGFSTSSRWELTFSDTAGTGSAFTGNGSLLSFVNGANSYSIALNQLNSSGLVLGFRNLDSMFIGIDNLLIEGTTAIPGDADRNGLVETADFLMISQNFYTTPAIAGQMGDVNFDGFVDEADFREWRVASGAGAIGEASANVPEPSALVLIATGAALLTLGRRVRRA